MAKYDPLFAYLRTQKNSVVRLTFAQIQSIVGLLPPESRKDKAWWATTKFRQTPQSKAWTEAGFILTAVHLNDFVVFERAVAKDQPEESPEA